MNQYSGDAQLTFKYMYPDISIAVVIAQLILFSSSYLS